MCSLLLPFAGKKGLTAHDNLVAFIVKAKMEFPSWSRGLVRWLQNGWDMSATQSKRVNTSKHVHFRKDNFIHPKHQTVALLDGKFIDWAKAVISNQRLYEKNSEFSARIRQLRLIEAALLELKGDADPTLIDSAVLDRVAEVIWNQPATSAQGHFSGLVRTYLQQQFITVAPITWSRPPIRRRPRSSDVTADIRATHRPDKLPHLRAIFDLATIYHESSAPADRLVTAWAALAMFAPSRVTEILTLPVQCAASVDDGEGGTAFGLAWRPVKGGMPMVKYATSDAWVELAKDAIDRLVVLGRKARIAARWYEEHPSQLYLLPGFAHIRGQAVTRWEITRILGREKEFDKRSMKTYGFARATDKAGNLLFTREQERYGGRDATGKGFPLWTFESVEQYALSHLPGIFPWVDEEAGLKLGEALFTMPYGILSSFDRACHHIPVNLTSSMLYGQLGVGRKMENIFERNDRKDPRTGEFWSLSSHQFRHLLNTLAQSKYISQELIAFWSGRKSIDQNGAYNRLPQEAIIEAFVRMGEAAPEKIEVQGPLKDKVASRAASENITKDEALKLEIGCTHVTRFGLCRHNYSLSLCPRDKNCISCGESMFIAHDERQIKEATIQLAIHENAAQRCREAIERGEVDARRWLEKHEYKAARWRLAIKEMTNPDYPKGMPITLPPNETAQTRAGLAQAIREADGITDPSIAEDEEITGGGSTPDAED